MLGSEEDCLRYKVTLKVFNESGTCSLSYSDHPTSIDAKDETKIAESLAVSDNLMKKLCEAKTDNTDKSEYKVTLTFEMVV